MEQQKSLNDALETTNKLAFEWFKHLTTLSFSAIVVIAALFRTFFAAPHWVFLVPGFFVSLFLATAGAVLMMLDLIWGRISAIPEYRDPPEKRKWRTVLFLVGSLFTLLCFLVGVLSFVAFAIRNLAF